MKENFKKLYDITTFKTKNKLLLFVTLNVFATIVTSRMGGAIQEIRIM